MVPPQALIRSINQEYITNKLTISVNSYLIRLGLLGIAVKRGEDEINCMGINVDLLYGA